MSGTNTESSDGSLTVMGRTIPPQQVKSLLRFYEADHQLTPEDRGILADDLVAARSRQLISGMLTSLIALFTPSMMKHFRDQARAKATGATAPTRPVFARPGLSISVACLTYFITMLYSGKVSMDLKIELLGREKADYLLEEHARLSKVRQFNVWKSLSADRLPLFAYYYQDTAVNPDHIMKDPRKLAAEHPNAGTYQPNSSTTQEFVIDSEKHTSAWSQIRQQNGIIDTPRQLDKLSRGSQEGSIDDYMSPQKNYEDYSTFYSSNESREYLGEVPSYLDKENKEDAKSLSAWDRVRRGK